MTTTQELLTKAADLIEEKGLNQDGNYHNPKTGCFCALGALAWADGKDDWEKNNTSIPGPHHWSKPFTDAVDSLTEAAGLLATYDIPKWNDKRATAEEVVETLRRAAAA